MTDTPRYDNTGRQPRQNQTDATDWRSERPNWDKEHAAEFPPVPEAPEEERRTRQARDDWRQQTAKREQERQRQTAEEHLRRAARQQTERLAHREPAAEPPWDESGHSGRASARTRTPRPYETE